MVSRFQHDRPREIAHYLRTAIGTRPATSLAEAQAAAYVDSRLRRAGLSVAADSFRAAASLGLTYALLGGLGVGAALLSYWLPLPALLLALYGLLLTVGDMLAAPLPVVARWRDSQNIIATRPCVGQRAAGGGLPRWRLVLLAPLDSPLDDSGLRMVAGRQPMALLGRCGAFGLLLLSLLLLVLVPHPLWYTLQLLPVAYLLFTLLPLRRASAAADTPQTGALAVLLAAMEQLPPLRSVEVWAVALGATSTSNSGLRNLLARYPFGQEDTLLLALEHMGDGPLVSVTRTGMIGQHQADALLLQLAAEAAANPTVAPLVAQPHLTAFSLANRVHRHGFRALTLRTASTALPAADTPPDPPAAPAADADPLDQTTRLVLLLARQLDGR